MRPCARLVWRSAKNGPEVPKGRLKQTTLMPVFFYLCVCANGSDFQPAAAPGGRPSLPLCRVVHIPAPNRAGLRGRHHDMDGFRRAHPRWSLLLSPWPVPVACGRVPCRAFAPSVPAEAKDQGLAALRACPSASASFCLPCTSFWLLCCARPCPASPPCPPPLPPLPRPSTSRLPAYLVFSAGMSIARVPHTVLHECRACRTLHTPCQCRTLHTPCLSLGRQSTRISLHGGCSR